MVGRGERCADTTLVGERDVLLQETFITASTARDPDDSSAA
jgi:hypothetical protein